MNKKSIEEKFSAEMDAYFKGMQGRGSSDTQEYSELLELGKTLADKDFSENSNKKAVFNKTIENVKQHKKGEDSMKNLNKTRKMAITAASVAAICVMSACFMKTASGQDFAEKIIKTISLGHISAVQTEPFKGEKAAVPDNLKGKIFDKDGKPIVEVSRDNPQKFYTAKGEEIDSFGKDGEPITVAQSEKKEKEQNLEIKNSNEINKHTCFKVILPNYLPEGYKFYTAQVPKSQGESNVVDSKYANVEFINEKTGKKIYMQQRFADETTKYEMGTDGKIEKLKVNGADAIVCDDRTIDWEANGVIYSLASKGTLSKVELIKVAESIK